MGTFTFGRIEGFPSIYPPHHSPVTVDVTEIIFVTIFVIIGIAYLCIVPGHSKKRSIYVAVKAVLSILIGCLLIVENFGQEWEVGYVKTLTPYRAGERHGINADIGVKIGLRSVNITLKAEGDKGTPLEKETIDYNERFWWTWDQGRFGFGPYAGLLQRNFREAQRRGVPIPILWIAEYFTIDGEGIRFGRFYRTAGWYCHILLWAAFAGWILANMFLQTVGRFAAYSLAGIGALQILTCVVWITVHNPTPLVIPFEDGTIRMRFGRHFYLAFGCGIVCIIIALVIVFMDLRYPNVLSEFLGINPLDEYDEFVMPSSEVDSVMRKSRIGTDMEMASTFEQPKDSQMVLLRRRSTIKNAQKSLYRKPIPIETEMASTSGRSKDSKTHAQKSAYRQPIIPFHAKSTEEAFYENQSVMQPPEMDVQYSNEQPEDYKPPIPKKVKRIKVVI